MSLDLVILGAGESGTGAALLAKAKGLSVFVSDKGSILPVYKKDLEKAGIEFEENQHTESKVLSAKEMVKSPGIPEKAEMVAKALAAGIPVIDELEFASRYTKARFIGITGSNGKTTTTLLTYHLMQACGFSVGLAGNIGQSLARQVITDAFDWYVLEISSFQLDGMHSFRSDIAILTNITPDHLDRYNYKFENYIASKFRIAQNLGPEQSLIISASDPVVSAEVRNRHFACSLVPVALNANASNLVFVAKGSLVFNHTAPSFSVPVSSLPISGDHNLMNAMMAISAVSLAGGDADKIREGAKSFVNAPHRCEFVTEISGVRFINDSKATNVDSVKYAFSAFEKPIVWIAGGVDKGNDYTELDEAVRSKVKALICLGKENDKLKTHFGPMLKLIEETQSVDDLIDMALRISEMGDTVLLSPACASFDLFRNYEDRGNQFKAAVLKAEAVLQSQTRNHEKQ
jgi:UDP-N-acetylmuramoylalanine--D-glutamate ligase